MFDWPPQSQTSPTITLWSSTVSWPAILTVYGPPTGGGWIFTCHRRSGPAIAEAVVAPISTETLSPGSDQPHIVLRLAALQDHVVAEEGAHEGEGHDGEFAAGLLCGSTATGNERSPASNDHRHNCVTDHTRELSCSQNHWKSLGANSFRSRRHVCHSCEVPGDS